MTTVAFFIVLSIAFLLVVALIVSIVKDERDNAGFFGGALALIILFGLFMVPFIIPSEDRITKKVLQRSEYELNKIESGFIINYKSEYALIDAYETVNKYNDSTEIKFVEQTTFYKTFPERWLEINEKKFKLKTFN